MLSIGVVVVAALLWLGLLFVAGLYGERHPRAFAGQWRHVYALSLAVHCTSWTFYGTVTQAARYGWPLPPTFAGAIVLYLLAAAFMLRLVRLARAWARTHGWRRRSPSSPCWGSCLTWRCS